MTRQRLEAIRSELRKSGWSRDMVNDLFGEIDTLTAERDEARKYALEKAVAEVIDKMGELTAERDQARALVQTLLLVGVSCGRLGDVCFASAKEEAAKWGGITSTGGTDAGNPARSTKS